MGSFDGKCFKGWTIPGYCYVLELMLWRILASPWLHPPTTKLGDRMLTGSELQSSKVFCLKLSGASIGKLPFWVFDCYTRRTLESLPDLWQRIDTTGASFSHPGRLQALVTTSLGKILRIRIAAVLGSQQPQLTEMLPNQLMISLSGGFIPSARSSCQTRQTKPTRRMALVSGAGLEHWSPRTFVLICYRSI